MTDGGNAGKASRSFDEARRMDALLRYAVLDTEPEAAFDRLASIAARALDMPIALVSLVDGDREWLKARVGAPLGAVHRARSFGAHAMLAPEPLVVVDAQADPRFSEHPWVVGAPHARFYAGAALTAPSGAPLGALSVLDRRPRELQEAQLDMLRELAAIAIDELELRSAQREHITALKDTEEALSRSQESLRTQLRVLNGVLESAGDGIVVADERGELLVFNPAAERILGVGAHRCRPEDWPMTYGLLTPDAGSELPADQVPLVRALRGESSDDVEILVRNSRVPGGVFISATGRPLLDAQGAVRGGVVTLSDVTKLKLAQRELARVASLDGLTGIPNHRAFKERLAQLAAEAERGRKFTLVLCDVDHFKQLNDTYGHPAGDRVLVAFAHALRENARATDMVARYGGEEFAVLYTDVDETRACTLVERMVRALGKLETPAPVTASFGVCEYSQRFRGDPSALLAAADRALYRAKDGGRNRVVRFGALD